MYVQQFEYLDQNVGEMQLPCASGPWSLFHHPYNAAPHASLRSCRCVVRRMAYAIWAATDRVRPGVDVWNYTRSRVHAVVSLLSPHLARHSPNGLRRREDELKPYGIRRSAYGLTTSFPETGRAQGRT